MEFLHYYWARGKEVKNEKMIHRGDVVRYGSDHITLVYSDRWHEPLTNGKNYELIHAFGYETSNNQEYDLIYPWHRKVGVTGNEHPGLRVPTGFGRIKLWE